MSIHILVPQERLAELLKKEHELDLLNIGGVINWKPWFDVLHSPINTDLLPLEVFKMNINKLLRTNGELAERLGYQYTVDTDAAYFENLEDMLGDEE